jgi:hypothetical protein
MTLCGCVGCVRWQGPAGASRRNPGGRDGGSPAGASASARGTLAVPQTNSSGTRWRYGERYGERCPPLPYARARTGAAKTHYPQIGAATPPSLAALFRCRGVGRRGCGGVTASDAAPIRAGARRRVYPPGKGLHRSVGRPFRGCRDGSVAPVVGRGARAGAPRGWGRRPARGRPAAPRLPARTRGRPRRGHERGRPGVGGGQPPTERGTPSPGRDLVGRAAVRTTAAPPSLGRAPGSW